MIEGTESRPPQRRLVPIHPDASTNKRGAISGDQRRPALFGIAKIPVPKTAGSADLPPSNVAPLSII